LSDSRVSRLYRKSVSERIDALLELGLLDDSLAYALRRGNLLSADGADKMVENVIGVFGLPFAVAPNFKVNGKDYIVPMVVEEPSIVAGVSNAARIIRCGGGFETSSMEPVLIGQIHLLDIDDPDGAIAAIESRASELLELANSLQPNLVLRGGGARAIECRQVSLPQSTHTVVVHLLVDTRDAMGANIVNTLCEGIAAKVEEITSGKAVLKILSNLADRSLVTATARVRLKDLAGKDSSAKTVRDRIVLANELANADPYRAATHNKGIMNGVDAVAVATGNDWRSVEAAAHAYAARDSAYRSLTSWSVDPAGNLLGEITMPIKVGTVGGSLKSNPGVLAALRISGVAAATELAELMAAVGLAQNFAALRALVGDGIQKGHMRLHARSVAAAAGTPDRLFAQVVQGLIQSGDIKDWKAEQLIAELRTDPGVADSDLPDPAVSAAAAGKVILLGEHAAVYDRHVLALPLTSAIAATVSESSGDTRLRISDWNIDWRSTTGGRENVAAALLLIVEQLGVADRGYDIRVRSRIPAAMGLGSSAALATAIIRAFDLALNLGLDDAAVNELAFSCEKIAHGDPSGIDNTLAVYGEPVLYKRSNDPPMQILTLAEQPPLVIACSTTRGITRDQVAAVRDRYAREPALYEGLFDEIDDISKAGAIALTSGDYDKLAALMNVCHGLLNAIQVSTPELEAMIEIARSHGAIGAKLTGGGGGGSIVALCPDRVEAVAEALRSAGYRIVNTTAEQGIA